ncbi:MULTISPECIES: PEP-CTERM sorting domain-containing protein [unclassified Anabaena]|uniref:PEP-CTERM sorting domain-containing protein n=1 Tax=unclassified Anabaena TaxID=2619674 RepID=UPI0039C5FF40
MVKINSLKAVVKKLAVVSSSAVLMTLSMNASAMAAIFYNLTDLGTLPGGTSSTAYGINDFGQVVGTSSISNGSRAFLWSPNIGMTDLGFLPDLPEDEYSDDYDISSVSLRYDSVAYDINNLGQVVGTSTVDFAECCFGYRPAPRSFIWSNDMGMFSIGDLLGDIYGDFANAINNRGEVVGASGRFGAQPYLWSEDIGVPINFLNSSGIGVIAYDINDASQIVGSLGTVPGGAFLWSRSDGFTSIAPSPSWEPDEQIYSEAYAINNLGQVVGIRWDSFFNNDTVFLWNEDTGITEIGSGVQPTGINDKTQVVGFGGFFWSEKTGRLDLNNLIDPNLGWSIERANAINNKGEIVGSGRNQNGELRAFLLTPRTVSKTVPEPNTIGGILLAGMGLTYLRRRQRQL